MAINVPQVQAKVAQFRAPSFQTPDVLGAMKEGRMQYAQRQEEQISNALRGELGKQAMNGDHEALNKIAIMPGGGAEVATELQGIVAGNNKAANLAATKTLVDKGHFYQAIRNEPDQKRRRSLLVQHAMSGLNDKSLTREEADEIMAMANQEDPADMDAELDWGIDLATSSSDYLQSLETDVQERSKEIRKGQRSKIENSQKGLSTRIDSLETAYEKVDTLVDEAQKGNRTAVSSVLVGLVKLQDPNSAVLVAEMEQALNEKDPLAAALEYAKGDTTLEAAITQAFKKVDALSPENINPKQIRATARALVKANIRPMQLAYQDNLMKSDTLSPEGARSAMAGNFGQRLIDMNTKFLGDDDPNTARITYNEINQQRMSLGMEPLIVPENTSGKKFVPDENGLMDGLTETNWKRREELITLSKK